MDLRQIRYFTRVAHLRSFSKAAEQLEVAQPALSRQVQALEEELDVQLLLRTTRGVEPTDAGLVFLERGEKILISIEEMREAVVRAFEHPAGELTLGLPPSLCASFAPLLLEDARKEIPDVRLRITEGLSVFLEEWLNQGRIDLAVLTKVGEMEGLSRVRLAVEEFALVASPGTLERGRLTIPLREVAALKLTITRGFRAVIDQANKDLCLSLDCAEYELDRHTGRPSRQGTLRHHPTLGACVPGALCGALSRATDHRSAAPARTRDGRKPAPAKFSRRSCRPGSYHQRHARFAPYARGKPAEPSLLMRFQHATYSARRLSYSFSVS